MSRSILDIVIAAQEDSPATERELRLALVAVSSMLYRLERSERELVEAVLAGKSAKLRAACAHREAEARFQVKKLAPEQYLGPDHTPGTPENARLRKLAHAIFERATGRTL